MPDFRTGRARTHATWKAMRDRCLNPNYRDYHYYGGRGITICERWMNFENFFEDMGARPLGLSIERKDNNGNYEPSNCVWASQSEQRFNSRPRSKISGV